MPKGYGRTLWQAAALIAALSLTAAAAAEPGPQVTAVRLGEHADSTRIVIEISERVDYRFTLLPDPYRVVIDLPELTWQAPAPKEDHEVGLVKDYRYGQFAPGKWRVVVDTAEPVKIKAAQLIDPQEGHGYRLIVDLAPQSREAFLAAANKATAEAPPVIPAQARAAAQAAAAQAAAAQGAGAQSAPTQPAAAQPAAIPPAATPPAAPQAATGAAPPKATAEAPTQQAALPQVPAQAAPPGPQAQPQLQPQPQPQLKPRTGKKVIVIDPGHGGVDPGAQGRTGVYEKFLTLSMGTELKRQLDATGRYKVVMTRDTDVFLPLRERIAVARAAGADLFISLHADTIDDSHIRGLSVYTLSETASDKEAAALAVSENKADVIAGVDLTNESPEVTNILIDLAQRETMNLSANFAEFAVTDLSHEAKLLGKTHRFAGFAVLKAPDVPSVLVELGYLSHPQEERQLREPSYRTRLASALVRSVDRFFAWKDGRTKS